MKFDELDRNIITLLGDNGRINNNELAKILDVTEGTVRKRIKKMLDSGEFKILGLVTPESIEEKHLVLLGVKVATSNSLTQKASEISKIDEVKCISITSGRYDLMLELWVDIKFGLIEFLSEKLGNIDGIVSTESFIVMKNYNKWITDN